MAADGNEECIMKYGLFIIANEGPQAEMYYQYNLCDMSMLIRMYTSYQVESASFKEQMARWNDVATLLKVLC